MQSPLQQHIARARAERRAAPESTKSPLQRRKSPGGYPGKSRRSPASRRVASSAADAGPSPRAEAARAREEEVRAAAIARRVELSARKKLFRKEKRLEKEQQRADEVS